MEAAIPLPVADVLPEKERPACHTCRGQILQLRRRQRAMVEILSDGTGHQRPSNDNSQMFGKAKGSSHEKDEPRVESPT